MIRRATVSKMILKLLNLLLIFFWSQK